MAFMEIRADLVESESDGLYTGRTLPDSPQPVVEGGGGKSTEHKIIITIIKRSKCLS